jgi:hypoxanthine phosphoribosyltransferase
MFASDLVKNIDPLCEITFIKIASYQAMHSTGKTTELMGLREEIKGRHVIVLEDIVDSGITMHQVLINLAHKNPLSVEVATLLFKPVALRKDVELKYVGFEIPNKFVVGYGLDYDALGRNLKDLYVLKEEA